MLGVPGFRDFVEEANKPEYNNSKTARANSMTPFCLLMPEA